MAICEVTPKTADSPAPRGSILLVDDEELIVRAFRRTLELAGYAVVGINDSRRALELARSHRFDAVLSDIRMPGLDGLGLLRALREQDPDVAVILMTGGPAVETAVEALESGAQRYLFKQIDAKVLTA